jgi:hypothetical protein
MSELLLLVVLLALGPFLVAEGLLARYELMVYTIGRRAPVATLPPRGLCCINWPGHNR